MGTRNYVEVRSGGRTRVRQYCQWDGYPSAAGNDLLDFVRAYDTAELRQRFDDVSLEVLDGRDGVTATGAPLTSAIADMSREYGTYLDAVIELARQAQQQGGGDIDYEACKALADMMLRDGRGEADYLAYKVASRDTGVALLPAIMAGTLPVKTHCLQVDLAVDAVYTVDLDAERIAIQWLGSYVVMDIEWARGLLVDTQHCIMEALEQFGYEALTDYDNLHGTALASTLVADVCLVGDALDPYGFRDEFDDFGSAFGTITANLVTSGAGYLFSIVDGLAVTSAEMGEAGFLQDKVGQLFNVVSRRAEELDCQRRPVAQDDRGL